MDAASSVDLSTSEQRPTDLETQRPCTARTPTERGSFEHIPDEVIWRILSFLKKEDLDAFSLVSKTCLRLTSYRPLWLMIFQRYFPKKCEALSEDQREQAVSQFLVRRLNPDPLVCAGSFCYPTRWGDEYLKVAVDGDYIATVFKCNVQLWNHRTGEKGHRLVSNSRNGITCCVMGDGIVVAGRSWGQVDVWDRANGSLKHTLMGCGRSVSACGISAYCIAAIAEWDSVCIWDRDSGACLHSERISYWDDVCIVNDVLIISGDSVYKFCVLDAHCTFHSLARPIANRMGSEACAVQDGVLYVAHGDGQFSQKYSVSTGAQLRCPSFGAPTCCSVEGNLVATGATRTGVLAVWNADSGTQLLAWDSGQKQLASCRIANGRIYSMGRKQSEVAVWDLFTGAHIQTIGNGQLLHRCYFAGTSVILTGCDPVRDNGEPIVHVWAPRSVKHVKLEHESPSVIDRARTVDRDLVGALGAAVVVPVAVGAVFLFAVMKR